MALARFMVKEDLSDPDSALLLDKSITTVNLTPGQITDTGADGTGVVKVYIQERDLLNFEVGNPCYYVLKRKLSDGEWYTLPGLKGLFMALDAGIEAPVFEVEGGTGDFDLTGNSIGLQ